MPFSYDPPSAPLQHAHLGDEDPFELIPSPFGVMERWRAVALQTGELGAMTVLSDHVKNDAIAAMDDLENREREISAREEACDQRERALGVTAAKFVDFVGQSAALFDRLQKAKADAEEEPLPLPPGHKSEEPDPTLNADTEPPAQGDPPDPHPAEIAERLRLKHPVTRDEDPEQAHPPVTAQPISAGLDNEK